MNNLIRSCREAHHGFRCASETAMDSNLKRLFNIYAHQRTRFAEELCGYIGESASELDGHRERTLRQFDGATDDRQLLQNCVEADRRLLELYQQAMKTGISTKAQFLLSAQFSLIQRVHERMNGLLMEAPKVSRMNVSVERAVL
jgi:hypothetical protein